MVSLYGTTEGSEIYDTTSNQIPGASWKHTQGRSDVTGGLPTTSHRASNSSHSTTSRQGPDLGQKSFNEVLAGWLAPDDLDWPSAPPTEDLRARVQLELRTMTALADGDPNHNEVLQEFTKDTDEYERQLWAWQAWENDPKSFLRLMKGNARACRGWPSDWDFVDDIKGQSDQGGGTGADFMMSGALPSSFAEEAL